MIILIKPTPVYFYQGDSNVFSPSGVNQSWRMCFASSCSMLLKKLKPGSLPDVNGDDAYLNRLRQLKVGDTTEYTAQLATLKFFGVDARFTQNANWKTLENQLSNGVPVPVGWCHHGPVESPLRSGGHWSLIIGIDDTHVTVHDPAGEADLVRGGYVSSGPVAGKAVRYSRKNWGRRWMVDSNNDGWAIIAMPDRLPG